MVQRLSFEDMKKKLPRSRPIRVICMTFSCGMHGRSVLGRCSQKPFRRGECAYFAFFESQFGRALSAAASCPIGPWVLKPPALPSESCAAKFHRVSKQRLLKLQRRSTTGVSCGGGGSTNIACRPAASFSFGSRRFGSATNGKSSWYWHCAFSKPS